jgi:hypothetical protein
MLGKKKYSQAELDAAVAVGKRGAELDAQNAAETAQRRHAVVRVIKAMNSTRQAALSAMFSLAWVDADNMTHSILIDLDSMWSLLSELEFRGFRP